MSRARPLVVSLLTFFFILDRQTTGGRGAEAVFLGSRLRLRFPRFLGAWLRLRDFQRLPLRLRLRGLT